MAIRPAYTLIELETLLVIQALTELAVKPAYVFAHRFAELAIKPAYVLHENVALLETQVLTENATLPIRPLSKLYCSRSQS